MECLQRKNSAEFKNYNYEFQLVPPDPVAYK